MVHDQTTPARRRRGRGTRPALIAVKLAGVVAFLGGVAALVAMGWLVPAPETIEEWTVLRRCVRAVFFPCLFCGLIVAVGAGVALLLQHPRTFLGLRWFRCKGVLLLTVLPALHFLNRGRLVRFDDALERGDLAALPGHWAAVTHAFTFALVVLIPIALLGRIKPRLGEPLGRRAGRTPS